MWPRCGLGSKYVLHLRTAKTLKTYACSISILGPSVVPTIKFSFSEKATKICAICLRATFPALKSKS